MIRSPIFPVTAVLLAASLALPCVAAPQAAASRQTLGALESPSPDHRRARKEAEKARQAEQREDWPSAFAAYDEALRFAPAEREYWTGRENARFQLVERYVESAERAAALGRQAEARAELQAALGLDPQYEVARDRLARLDARHAAKIQVLAPADPPPVELQPQPGKRSFRVRGNIASAYEDLGRQFGLTVTLDPELPPRQLRFNVDDVDFATAIQLLSRQTNTFWRAIDAHAIFVAENSPRKRQEYAPQVVRTVVLPGSVTPEHITETQRVVRELAGITHTQLDTRTHSLTLRDTPQNVALAIDLIEEIEQSRGELMLEVSLLELDRNAARRLGVTPPNNPRLITISPDIIQRARQSPEQLLSVLATLFGGVSGPTIPPLVAFGGGRSILLATLPGAAASFSDTLSSVRSARRMLLRATDGEQATFFVGTRFPVNLATFAANFGVPQLVPLNNQQTFRRADFATGSGPTAIATADFNGNGHLDLAITNENANTVSILLGNADGTFAAHTDFATGSSPRAVVAGNFNSGTFVDLVVVNGNSNSVSVLLGNGDGTFQPRMNFPTGTAPRAIAAGDFNSDGRLDLAVVNEASNTVSILLGNGDGTFQPRMDFPTGSMPSAVLALDFNRDGRLDLAVTNAGSNSVSILLGNGDGTFQPRTDFATGTAPSSLTSGLFDSDAFLDLAVANSGDNSVSILLGNGDGTFQARRDLQVGTNPRSIVGANFTADGFLDLAVANSGSANVTVLLGNGDGTFPLNVNFPAGTAPFAVLAADFNGDSRADLAAVNNGSDSVTITLNSTVFVPGNVNRAFGTPTPFPGFQYEDLGLKVRATPHLHPGSEVTLQLSFEIRDLTGQDLNGIPVISNRTVEQTVRLREGETSILAGILQDSKSRALTGYPLFSRVPAAGLASGNRRRDQQESELLIAITPRRVRLNPRQDRSRFFGRDTFTSGGGESRPPQ